MLKDKILIWIDQDIKQYCLSYYLKDELDADFFAIIDVTNETRDFFANQKLINFKKKWFYHDFILPLKKKPDTEFLSLFEKKYGINLWKLTINDRLLYGFNDFYKFSKNEILSILENECRFFEKVLSEISPDFVIMHEPYNHQDELFYELCKSKNIKILTSFSSTFGYKCEISETVHRVDNLESQLENIKKIPLHRDFKELRDYLESFKISEKIKKINTDPFGNKSNILNAAMNYLFKIKNKNQKTHFSYFGRSKLRVILNSINGSLKTRLRWKYVDKHLSKDVDYSKKFIFYPLHVEQERSTLIATPFYTNDLEFIKNIAKSIPIDYILYVKEHPSQFTRHWRQKFFYEEIKKIPNVHLIHPHIPALKLIKNSSLVITRSGTVALEAAFYKKPSICCTDFDYTILESVERMRSIEELPNLIQKSLRKNFYAHDLDSYVSLIDNNTFNFDLTDFDAKIVKHFFHGGRLVDVKITDLQMKIFLENNKNSLQIFTKFHIKKIDHFKNQIG